ncbi:CvpA family protein [Falsihalocynthiibacter arcticus]|uniref:Colicin V production CvpA n=1 Tax=Falsihalocynthiibacter arcticus TaxID=1579316 RepID=A0A126V4I2_9RHOB|nr:CvpA family protein [Falsihalocynthiibacter arcticus]AML53183.1 colicin V production CvpA [Falsihalocynthiibacter arcticus]
MEGFTIVDGVVAIVIILSAVLAYSRGFVRETLSIASWVVAAIVAYIFAPKVEPLVREIPILKDMIGGQCELSLMVAFVIVLVIGLVVMAIFTPLFSSMVQRSILGGLDQGIGFLFGAARGVLLVVVSLFIYDWAVTDQTFEVVDNSRSAVIFSSLVGQVGENVPDDVPGWLQSRVNSYLALCEAPADIVPAEAAPAEVVPAE